MNVLVAHNFYQQPGGEDVVFREEAALLERFGHKVVRHSVHNDAVAGMGKIALAAKTLFNGESRAEIRGIVEREKIDVAHFHNTFPLISPAAYVGAREGGAAVVQTLHNYRLICPAATLFRDGHVCNDCVNRLPWPGVVHACYRGSRAITAMTTAMIAINRFKYIWNDAVDLYVALTAFARDKFIAGGLPPEKLAVKPNFVDPDPGVGPGFTPATMIENSEAPYAVFVGRLTEEKGILTALRAWNEQLSDVNVRLKVVGDGPLRERVESEMNGFGKLGKVDYLGRREAGEVYDIVGKAAALVFPSEWYEGLPKTIVESLAKGTPVIASNLGSMIELVKDKSTGWLFKAGDAGDLGRCVRELSEMIKTDRPKLASMRAAARAEFERRFTADLNYPILERLYRRAMENRERQSGRLVGERV